MAYFTRGLNFEVDVVKHSHFRPSSLKDTEPNDKWLRGPRGPSLLRPALEPVCQMLTTPLTGTHKLMVIADMSNAKAKG
jgi:hypothetical protein